MNNRTDRHLLMSLAIVTFVFGAGSRSNCSTQPATIDCSTVTLSMNVQRGQCAQFNNSCGDQLWVAGDSWELDSTPSGVSVTANASPTVTRTLCVAQGAVALSNQPLSFTYSRSGEWGQGTMYLTTGVPLTVSVSSNASAPVAPGTMVQLSAAVSGGVGPYTFSWTPAGTLSPSGAVQNPVATPSASTTYVLVVTDSSGSTVTGSVQVLVTASVNATVTPAVVDPNQPAQLNVQINGGVAPFSITWSPPGSLSDPHSASPVATATVSENYVVTVTDATGAIYTASVTLTVNVQIVSVTASPTHTSPGGEVQLFCNVLGGTPPYFFSWVGDVRPDPYQQNPFAFPTVTTTYIVDVSDSIGGFAESSVTVNVP